MHTHLPDEVACTQCGGELRKLGEDVSEMLEYVPASFKVIRHIKPKLSCTMCDVIVQAPAPSRPIERGLAGSGLLAHVLVSKYADHLPLYRQSEIYARADVDLDCSTFADWVGAASYLLRKGEHPKHHLSNFSGILQADGYAGFYHLYERGRIVEVHAGAHLRRKFYDIHVTIGSATAAEAIERIGFLYDIDREIRGKPTGLRYEIRKARARPLMDDLHRWFHRTLAGLSRKSNTAMAIGYSLSRWRALTRYLHDGRIEIDNSAAERALRAVALGRKNSHDRLHCQVRLCLMT